MPNSQSEIALLPLDRAWGLARDVETDAVDAFDFVADARRNSREQFVRKAHPIGGHTVVTFDNPQHDRVFVSALITHYADGADGQKHGERLPDTVIPVARFHFTLH